LPDGGRVHGIATDNPVAVPSSCLQNATHAMPRSDGYARMSAVARSNGLRSREMCADHSVCVLLFSESAAVMVNALRRVQSDLTELN